MSKLLAKRLLCLRSITLLGPLTRVYYHACKMYAQSTVQCTSATELCLIRAHTYSYNYMFRQGSNFDLHYCTAQCVNMKIGTSLRHSISLFQLLTRCTAYRRRIKGKVVAAACGQNCLTSLPH